MINLDLLPQTPLDGTEDERITEVLKDSETSIQDFLHGFCYADDTDVASGTPFERDGRWVVRLMVGIEPHEWDEETAFLHFG